MSDKNPAESALDSVREVLSADERSGSGTTFMRGLTLGALLGAAIAGSALWQRRTRRKQVAPPEVPADTTARQR
jgi:hypothetical protein